VVKCVSLLVLDGFVESSRSGSLRGLAIGHDEIFEAGEFAGRGRRFRSVGFKYEMSSAYERRLAMEPSEGLFTL
jgi:hypothetical protein